MAAQLNLLWLRDYLHGGRLLTTLRKCLLHTQHGEQ
jgi:hypothetical protein